MSFSYQSGAGSLNEGQRLIAMRRGRTSRWIKAHPLASNVILASLNLGLQVLFLLFNYGVGLAKGENYTLFGLFILLVGNLIFSALILIRQKAPVVLLALAVVADFLYFLMSGVYTSNSITGFCFWIFLYTIAAERTLKLTMTAYTVLTLVMCGMAIPMVYGDYSGMDEIAGAGSPAEDPFPYLVVLAFSIGFTSVFNLVIIMFGRFTHKNNEFDREVIERFEQTQVLAAAEERTRIAREMHDVVAHSLTVMITLSDGARIVGKKNPERADEVLKELSQAGRTALSDMRRTLGVLREPGPDIAPLLPAEGSSLDAVENLEELVGSFRATGMPVSFEHSGEGIPSDNNLRLSLYRIIQESLTNSLRYGRNVSTVKVRLNISLPDIWVIVVNDGSAALDNPGSGLTNLGSGKGLTGIKERAAFYDGSVEAGPNDVGGWTTRAHLVWNPPSHEIEQ